MIRQLATGLSCESVGKTVINFIITRSRFFKNLVTDQILLNNHTYKNKRTSNCKNICFGEVDFYLNDNVNKQNYRYSICENLLDFKKFTLHSHRNYLSKEYYHWRHLLMAIQMAQIMLKG